MTPRSPKAPSARRGPPAGLPGARPGGRLRSVKSHLALAGASAVVLSLIFAGVGWWPLAFVALTPAAVLAARSGSAKRLGWTSLLVFFAWWAVMIRWIIPVTGPGWVGLAALMAGYWTLAVVAIHWLHRRYEAALTLSVPLVWVSLELIRAQWPQGGFGWFMLGHALAAAEPADGAGRLVQVADLFGAPAVSFLPAMTAGFFADLLTRPLMRPRQKHWRRVRRSIRWAGGFTLLLLLGAWGYGQYRISQYPAATSPGPRLSVVQSNIPQSNKNHPTRQSDRQAWQALVRLTEQAAEQPTKPDAIVWPEGAVPSAINMAAVLDYRYRARRWAQRTAAGLRASPDAAAYQAMAERFDISLQELPAYMALWNRDRAGYRRGVQSLADRYNRPLLVGAFAQWAGPEHDQRHNSVYHLAPGGFGGSGGLTRAPLPRYDKLHLVPFGEYIPWVGLVPGLKDWFLRYLTPYESDYSVAPGESVTVFSIEHHDRSGPRRVPLTTPVCFEDVDGPLCRRMIYGGSPAKRAAMLVNVTNDGWFVGTNQPWQQLQIATLRCIENRVPMARSVNTGVSGFIDSLGRVRKLVTNEGRAAQVTGTATHRMRLDRRRTFYGRWGQWPMIVLAGLAGVLMLGGLARPDKISGMRHKA